MSLPELELCYDSLVISHIGMMKIVNIMQLKNNLSAYLNKVRSGEEIVVRDRNGPVDRIVPWSDKQDDELLKLVSGGVVRLGSGYVDDRFWQLPAPRVPEQALHDAISAERADA